MQTNIFTKVIRTIAISLVGLAVIVVMFLMAFGYGIEKGHLPSPYVLRGAEIPTIQLETLREENIIDSDEVVHYFYSGGFWSILEDGNLFTDRRVISYETYEDEFSLYEATYDQIDIIEFEQSFEVLGISIIDITTKDGDGFILYVDNEDKMDVVFRNKLIGVWEQRKARKDKLKVEASMSKLPGVK